MKKLFLLIAYACFLSETISAQALLIPYQAVARNSTGEIVSNQTITIRISILDDNVAGPVLYSETHSVTTNSLGLFTLNIGGGAISSTSGPFDPTKWNILATFGKIEMDITGGINYIEMGTTQILSVPFAAVAARTPGAVNYISSWDVQSNSPPLNLLTASKGDYYVVNVAGNTDLNGITDWKAGDWAIYNGTVWEKVDNTESVTSAEVNAKVNRSGDTMTGDLLLNADPTSPLGAVTKQYVDGQFENLIDSYVHKTDDGIAIYLPPGGTRKRFGIGDLEPGAVLGIKGEPGADDQMISFKSLDNSQKWNINLNPTGNDVDGFSIDDNNTAASVSRFFIQPATGNIGIGNVTPLERLEINGYTSEGITGLKILNTATAGNFGWKIGHVHNSTDAIQDDKLEIKFGAGLGRTDLTILKSGNVGINESIPDVKLHVSRPLSDAQSTTGLISGTGIAQIGPMTDNIVFDYRGLQARHGEYAGSVLTLETADLNLQRLGGNILIHGDASAASGSRAIITSDAKLGLGTITPNVKLHVSRPALDPTTPINLQENTGILCLGQIDEEHIVADNHQIQVRKPDPFNAGSLVTSDLNLQPYGGSLKIYAEQGIEEQIVFTDGGRLGIGTATPSTQLDIKGKFRLDNNADPIVSGSSILASITNNAQSSGNPEIRAGVMIECSGPWIGNMLSKNIGIYVSDVSGAADESSNIAAVLNGNTVIGDISTSPSIGSFGVNVLAIQNGVPPASPAGSSIAHDGGFQIYSANDVSGTSLFHLMNGNGQVIKLFRNSALTPADNSSLGTTYGSTEIDVINNLRARINELEAKLQSLGLLE